MLTNRGNDIRLLMDKITALEAENSRLVKENEELTVRVDDLFCEIRLMEEHEYSLDEEISNLENERDELQSINEELEEEIRSLENDLSEYDSVLSENEMLKEENFELSSRVNELENWNEYLSEE